MELATPDIQELKSFIKDSYSLSCDILERILNNYRTKIDNQITSYAFRYPLEKIRKYSQMVDLKSYKIVREIEKKILAVSSRIALLSKSIELNDIDKTLKKGFALIRQNSKFISRKNKFNLAEPAIIKFYDGEIKIN